MPLTPQTVGYDVLLPSSLQAAVVRCVPPLRPNPPSSIPSAAGPGVPALSGGSTTCVGVTSSSSESLPLDWAHLHATAGITHFAALPLYHGTTLAGALTVLGSNSSAPLDSAQFPAQPSAILATLGSVNGGGGATLVGLPAYVAAVGSNAGGVSPQSCLDSLFRAPLSLELVAMAVAQCCLGADMALARHAVEMVQAMHACASIQQLVAGISLGLQVCGGSKVGGGLGEGRRRGRSRRNGSADSGAIRRAVA